MFRLPAIIGLMAMGILPLPGASEADSELVMIVNSGSTNRAGFRIVVDRSGNAEFTATPRRLGPQQEQAAPIRKTVARALIDRFYADLTTAKPFSSLPAAHCMKSASFGSVLRVDFGGEQTPDLSCGDGGNPVLHNLIRDTNEIVGLFHGN